MTVDVAARLAQGRPAVANTEAYVDACRAVGYQNADLTSRGGQIGEWYSTEDGLDLAALDADCAALRAAAGPPRRHCGSSGREWLRSDRPGVVSRAAPQPVSWSGTVRPAPPSREAVRSAAEVCAALRDKLWGAVDAKVAAATAIDDRRAGERTAWLAAARTVTTGAADREAATEIVRQQITPYVDADIRTEWLGAMRSATGAVDAAYDEATGTLGAAAGGFRGPRTIGAADSGPGDRGAGPGRSSRPAGRHHARSRTGPPRGGVGTGDACRRTGPGDACGATGPTRGYADTAGHRPRAAAGWAGRGIPPAAEPGWDRAGTVGAGERDHRRARRPVRRADRRSGRSHGWGCGRPVDPPDGKPDEPDEKPADEKPTDEKPADDEPVAGEEPVVPQPDPIVPDATAPPPVEPEPEPAPAVPPPGPPEPDPSTPCEIAADELPQVGQ